MKRVLIPSLFIFIVLYSSSFIYQERVFKEVPEELSILPSSQFLKACSGYLHQVVAETAFVQSAVFIGGVEPGTDPENYAHTLANNYLQITTLYPEFQDPYYFAQSNLAYVAPQYATAVNEVLDNGRRAYPENLIFPFFQAYNHFRYLNEPLKAAEIFREASHFPDAPPMFAHLAATLSAEGGMLEAAIISLTALLRSSDDEIVQERYQKEIDVFKKALSVQRAVIAFYNDLQYYPENFEELVPQYLKSLPEIDPTYKLTWNPPVVGVAVSPPTNVRD